MNAAQYGSGSFNSIQDPFFLNYILMPIFMMVGNTVCMIMYDSWIA